MGCKGSKAAGSEAATKTLCKAQTTELSHEQTTTATEPLVPGQSAKELAAQEAQPAADDSEQAELTELNIKRVSRSRSALASEFDEPKADEAEESKEEGVAQAEPSREAEAAEVKDIENAAPEAEAEVVVDKPVSKEAAVADNLSEASTAEDLATQKDATKDVISLALFEDSVRPIDEDTDGPKETFGVGNCMLFCCRAERQNITK